ncbi:MAG: EpsG family protein [Clostridia bacterium]|nr:EpsG family protein [Clostridia bacterium]
MIVHYILFFVTVLLSKLVEKDQKNLKTSEQQQQETRASFIAAIIVYLPVIIMYGLRDNIGDTGGYIDTFNAVNVQSVFDGLSDRNPGYNILQNFIKLYITKDPNIFLLIFAAISVILMVSTHSRFSPMFALSSFIFFGSTEVSYVFNGARQFLSVAIMFYTLKYVEEKKLWKYILLSIVAASIHQTAVIVIPAYFLAKGKYLNVKIIITGVVTVIATAFSSLFIDYLNQMFISESVYAHYYDRIVETEGLNIFRVLVAAVPFALCMIYKKRIDELDDGVLNYCANMSTLALAISIFSAASGGELLGRLAEYYLIYNTLTYPMLFKRVATKSVGKILTVGLMVSYFIFFWYQFTVVWGQGYQSDTLGISIGMEGI